MPPSPESLHDFIVFERSEAVGHGLSSLPSLHPDDLAWPGGEGQEIGTLRGQWKEVKRAITRAVLLREGKPDRLALTKEDGREGLVLKQQQGGPTVLTEPEDHLPFVISVIAPVESDADERLAEVHALLAEGLGSG